jgi:hypothetical protein
MSLYHLLRDALVELQDLVRKDRERVELGQWCMELERIANRVEDQTSGEAFSGAQLLFFGRKYT